MKRIQTIYGIYWRKLLKDDTLTDRSIIVRMTRFIGRKELELGQRFIDQKHNTPIIKQLNKAKKEFRAKMNALEKQNGDKK